MLLLEVRVPALCGRYDFELEEGASIEVLIQEIVAVICQKERCQCFEGQQGLQLYRNWNGSFSRVRSLEPVACEMDRA